MKASVWCAAVFLAAVALSGCGSGQDRAALAKQTVQTYWNDIGHFKFNKSYAMLTSGQRQNITLTNYGQNLAGFVESTNGVRAIAGNAIVNGDYATVPVTLKSPKETSSKQDLHAYQHLFWENGHWRVSDDGGGLSHQKD